MLRRRRAAQAFLLAVNPGAQAAREFQLHPPQCAIGSDDSNDLVIREGTVSRRHALLRWHRQRWQVLDRDSTNGTYIGERRAARWSGLRDGQELRFGSARYIFRLGAVHDSPPAGAVRSAGSRLRLFLLMVPLALIVGFAAAQYFFYRSYQNQEAALQHRHGAR